MEFQITPFLEDRPKAVSPAGVSYRAGNLVVFLRVEAEMRCSWFFLVLLGLGTSADRRAHAQGSGPPQFAPRQCFWVGALALALLFTNNARGDLNYPTCWSLSGRQTHTTLADINMNAGANGFTVT